jgi:hypothetical protein
MGHLRSPAIKAKVALAAIKGEKFDVQVALSA